MNSLCQTESIVIFKKAFYRQTTEYNDNYKYSDKTEGIKQANIL